ncbi:developmentally-regulated GTP-binding protein 2 [Anoplophora glabripennis]|uniref:developmentally-regulated GTP-binding protein 2 n=1 Tax=Anoplophora glabripennis TaxID=217634 RepID=UPI000C75A2B5|nr:developmentally-regulated GTP-binding protein 2 [Anoplophora glabripennis]
MIMLMAVQDENFDEEENVRKEFNQSLSHVRIVLLQIAREEPSTDSKFVAGVGTGRQVIAVARTADLVLMMLDATKKDVHRHLLEKELESVGIRLNKKKPNIYFKVKKGGGISFNSTCPLTKIDEKLVQMILHEYKIFNAEVLFREDCTADELIDVICANRVYLPCLYVYNKIDQISIEEVDRIARQPNSVVVRYHRVIIASVTEPVPSRVFFFVN